MSGKEKIVLGIIGGFILLVAVTKPKAEKTKPVGKDEEVKTLIETTKPTPISKRDVFKESFMEGCLEDGETGYQECSCFYDYLLSRYGLNGILDMEEEMEYSDEIPDEMFEAVNYCLE